ncbi:MAG: Methyltransferase domain, partial [Candidatus Sumerlaeota bacterium]|nr:Methyltransferase domain [Candidatus Sumerlaeota bacterium]
MSEPRTPPPGVCLDYCGHYLTRKWDYYVSYLKRFSNEPKRILELGCGLGQFLECCRHHGIEAVGVEYSEK